MSESSLYLTFRLEDELFAVDVSQVREVLDVAAITKIPRALDFMRGIINIRGTVVPVIDLRTKFGMTETRQTLDSRIVVMEIDLDGETTLIGAMADSVHEVLELDRDQIEPPPRLGSRWRIEFIKGVGTRDEEFILILDIDRVFSAEELTRISAVDTSAQAAPVDDEKE
ncbi:MAG: chemotaxis protein CheW [Proteobacteria bacterium]|nr:chemotaxis protein CheW [Pseudomonadota bacterium]MBU1737247.1 chemotaxis protein CheW [Pseudomonadota bacterium]